MSARSTVIALFAGVLALQAADLATIGAVGGQLEADLGIDHLQLGVLAATVSIVSAIATLPFGVLADRANRVRLLAITVVLWGAAMIAAGLSGSFLELLGTRCLLGIVVAAAGPILASLMGDLFPGDERAKVYGYVLTGELIGSAFGFLVSGNLAGVFSWRWSFIALALPSLVLAAALWRLLAEPERGGQSGVGSMDGTDERLAQRMVRRDGPEPSEGELLERDPASLGWWGAARHVLSVRTNLVLIAVSATGYLFLGGVQTFGVVFVQRQYGLGQNAATSMLALLGIGAVAGALVGGRLADRFLRGGRLDARVVVPAVSFSGAAALLLLPFAAAWPLIVAMPLFVLATAVLSSGNPPLDAARLDVMPSALWGRAEAIRTALRSLAITAAPLLFGFGATVIGDGSGESLRLTFLVMLAPLAVAGALLLPARRTYPADVAAAGANERRSQR